MKILLIGNGFDLEHNLPTSYKKFLEFCEKFNRIFSYADTATKDKYKQENLDDWDMDDSIKDALFHAFEERTYSEISKENGASDLKVTTSDPLLNELHTLLNKNTWLIYFQKRQADLGDNWIDFESEISRVIKTLDLSKKYLLTHENILGCNLKDEPILIEVLMAAATTLQTVLRNSDTVENFASFLNTELDKLIRALEIYLSCFINKIEVSRLSSDIEPLNPDCVLSFNYSNTYERIYGAKKDIQYAYIHGKADASKNVTSCNMVLGIDEYLTGENKNTELEFLTFKKYYQRIYKSTDNLYLEWVDEIKDGYADYCREIEAAYARNNIPEKQRPRTVAIGNRIYTEGPPMHCPQHTLYIFGHSLDVTDQDVLKMFICNNNVQTKIFYYRENADDKKSLGKIIKNLIGVMGQEELIRRTGGAHKTIEFIPQTLH